MINRRESLRLIAGTAAALVAGSGLAARLRAATDGKSISPVTLTPEAEQGPFYIIGEQLRRDIREGRPGVPLDLRVRLLDASTGGPISNAGVDIWHCDAGGVYSGFTKMKMGPPPDDDEDYLDALDGHFHGPPSGPPGGPGQMNKPTDASSFLRGVQFTGTDGTAEFTTIYPGWYQGREIHIHLKVHLQGSTAKNIYTGGHVSHTGQLFFPDETNLAVSKMSPYASSTIPRTTKATDHVYRDQNGDKTIVGIHAATVGSESGYGADITLVVDPGAIPQPVGLH